MERPIGFRSSKMPELTDIPAADLPRPGVVNSHSQITGSDPAISTNFVKIYKDLRLTFSRGQHVFDVNLRHGRSPKSPALSGDVVYHPIAYNHIAGSGPARVFNNQDSVKEGLIGVVGDKKERLAFHFREMKPGPALRIDGAQRNSVTPQSQQQSCYNGSCADKGEIVSREQ